MSDYSTSPQEKLVKRDIMFTFGPTTPELQQHLDELHADLSQRIYSTHSQLVVSDDKTQAKISLWCNVAQAYNLDGFLRNVPGVKYLSEDDPVEQLATIIKLYHQHMWNELTYPHEEMRLSALVTGIARRRATLDYPDFRDQPEIWRLAEECYNAMEQSNVFEDLAPYQKMIGYSFFFGYLAEQGQCETAQEDPEDKEYPIKMKVSALDMEEKGMPHIIIHTHAELTRDKLIEKGYRNTMELVQHNYRRS